MAFGKGKIAPLRLGDAIASRRGQRRARGRHWSTGYFLRQADELALGHALYRAARREEKGRPVSGKGAFYWRGTRRRSVELYQQRFGTPLPPAFLSSRYRTRPSTDADHRWWDHLFGLHVR